LLHSGGGGFVEPAQIPTVLIGHPTLVADVLASALQKGSGRRDGTLWVGVDLVESLTPRFLNRLPVRKCRKTSCSGVRTRCTLAQQECSQPRDVLVRRTAMLDVAVVLTEVEEETHLLVAGQQTKATLEDLPA
jgi:hypothetical protein